MSQALIYAGTGYVAVRHGPIPWRGNVTRQAADVKQLYAKRTTRLGRGSNRIGYAVHAILDKCDNVKVLGGLDSEEQAIFIEKEIEKFLGIEDRKVPGEIG